MDPWLASHLVCPRDQQPVEHKGAHLICPEGHEYPCVDGIPVMLLPDVPHPHRPSRGSLEAAQRAAAADVAPGPEPDADGVDDFVHQNIVGTCGRMYRNLGDRLTREPIPEIRLPPGEGKALLDIGCGWGRWTISAARKGFIAVGIDSSLDSARAAQRVATKLGATALFIVGDSRYLPFADHTFDVVFSYSVLQHFPKENCRQALGEIGRSLKPHTGYSLIQMATRWSAHNLVSQVRQRFQKQTDFRVRYWPVRELKRAFEEGIGPTKVLVDGFFALDAQATDLDLLPRRYRLVVRNSEFLRKLSERMPWMVPFADSVYLKSQRGSA